MLRILTVAVLAFWGTLAQADDLPTIRAAVLKIGTVNWELATITENGLDKKHGFKLDVYCCGRWRGGYGCRRLDLGRSTAGRG